MSQLKNHIYCPYFGSEFREKWVKNRVKRDFLVSLENYTVSLDSSLVFYLILTQNWTVKVICWISLAWPNLAYFYFAMAQLGPFLFCLGPAWLSLVLVISLSQCTGACREFALESLRLPFILSGDCCPSEVNYCSNPFEVCHWFYYL